MSHKDSLVKSLKTYLEKFPKEKVKVAKFIKLIAYEENCFKRENLDAHITASCLLLNNKKDSVLLTHHKKLNSWLFLGGHADGNENSLAVSLQEANEESGINEIEILSKEILDIDIHSIPKYKEVKEHKHYDICYVLHALNDDFKISNESNDLKWVLIENIEKYTQEERMLRIIEKFEVL